MRGIRKPWPPKDVSPDGQSKTASRTDRETRATELLKEKPLRDFISIRVQWLDRSLGKAR